MLSPFQCYLLPNPVQLVCQRLSAVRRQWVEAVDSLVLSVAVTMDILCVDIAVLHLTAISDFANKHRATLTVMEGGEHWFRTEEQMLFLDNWIKGKNI